MVARVTFPDQQFSHKYFSDKMFPRRDISPTVSVFSLSRRLPDRHHPDGCFPDWTFPRRIFPVKEGSIGKDPSEKGPVIIQVGDKKRYDNAPF